MILKFYDFLNSCLSEKWGVPLRVDQQDDSLKISEIVNSFMNNISKNVDNDYEEYVNVIDKNVQIEYKPNDKSNIDGFTSKDGKHIIIYIKLNKFNYLDVKYTLIHELVHSFQKIKLYHKRYDIEPFDKVKDEILRPSIDDVLNTNGKSQYFMYLIYREYIYEISAWTNNAYLIAYKFKKDNTEISDNDVISHVLDRINLDNNSLNAVISYIKTDNMTFQGVLSMLVGQFSELKTNINNQSYFDKSIFELPVVKNMKKQLSILMKDEDDYKKIVKGIEQIINININEILEYKDVIIDSFIKHLEYWYKQAKVKMCKAIQLGIEDAKK